MNKYNIVLSETRTIITDKSIYIMAENREEAETLALDYLEDVNMRAQVVSNDTLIEDLYEYEIIPEEEFVEFDDSSQLTLPEVTTHVKKMSVARRIL